MIDVPLQPVPSQNLTIQIDDTRFDITLHDIGQGVAATILRDGVTLVSGSRVVAGTPLLPYRFMEEGNLVLLVENEDLPTWEEFGVSQSLVYVDADEIAALRGT